LARCIDSALAQTLLADCEIIVVDDGSPDGAGAIADEYARREEKVKVFHQANAGLAEARHTGVKHASGEFIMFLDSDDTLPTDAAAFLYGKAIEGDYDMVYGSYMRYVGDTPTREVGFEKEREMTGDEFCGYSVGMRSRVANWGCISRRTLWQHDVFPPSDVILPSEDVFINIKLSRYIKRMALSNHVVYNYFYNAQSLSVTGRLSNFESWKRYYDMVEDELKLRGLDEALAADLLTQKIDRLAFYIKDYDPNNEWVRSVLENRSFRLTPKYALLQHLLRHRKFWHTMLPIYKKCKYGLMPNKK